MAVWKRKVGGIEVKIHNMDHPPPHCHAFVEGRDLKVTLDTLTVLNPPPSALSAGFRKALVKCQPEMLRAWEKVHIHPPGSDPTWDVQSTEEK